MVWEKNTGQMVPYLEDFFIKVKRRMVNFNGLMVALIKETLMIICFKVREYLNGKTIESIKDSGIII